MPQDQPEKCTLGATDVPVIRQGQRYGNMERDAIVSHGAARFIYERLLEFEQPYPDIPVIRGHLHIRNNNELQFYTASPVTN